MIDIIKQIWREPLTLVAIKYGIGVFCTPDYEIRVNLSRVEFNVYEDITLERLFRRELSFDEIDNRVYLVMRSIEIRPFNKDAIFVKGKKRYYAIIGDYETNVN